MTTTGQSTDPRGERVHAAIRKAEQTGDPRYLAGVQWCVEQRCKILGLNAPQKVAPTDPTGTREYAPLTDADRLTAKGDLKAAEIQLKNAVRSDPKNMVAHYRLAVIELQLGQAAAAEREDDPPARSFAHHQPDLLAGAALVARRARYHRSSAEHA